MRATVQLSLDQVMIGRLCRLGYLHPQDRNPAVIRDAALAALADRLAPSIPATEPTDGRRV